MQRLPVRGAVADTDGTVLGHVQYIDHFGNCVTDIPAHLASANARIRVEGEAGPNTMRVGRTYADVAPGTELALVGSMGFLEIAVRNGNAASTLGLRTGAEVRLTPPVDQVHRRRGEPTCGRG